MTRPPLFLSLSLVAALAGACTGADSNAPSASPKTASAAGADQQAATPVTPESGAPAQAEAAPAAPADQAAPAAPADQAAPANQAAPAASGAAAAAPAPTAGKAPAAAGSISVKVENVKMGQSGTPGGTVSATATTGTNKIVVHLDHLTTYCSPAPAFSAEVKDQTLRLELKAPTGRFVSRCFAAHSLDAIVSLPGRNNVREVKVVRQGGALLVTTPVTSGKK